MRRSIVMVMVLIATMGIFFAIDHVKRAQNVKFDLTASGIESFKILFTSTPIDSVTAFASASSYSGDITLTASNDKKTATKDGGLYLSWYSYVSQSVKVSLVLSAMGDDIITPSKYLNWSVTSKKHGESHNELSAAVNGVTATVTGSDNTTNGTKDVVSVANASGVLQEKWGNEQLTISATLEGASPAAYTGTITATISTD